jgi:DNA-binding MarR family transcriptional regulator
VGALQASCPSVVIVTGSPDPYTFATLMVNVANEFDGSVKQRTPSATEVANRLRPVLMKLARELRREVHPLGVTGGQVALLFQIRRRRGVSAGDLAASEGISPAAMSGYVDRLAKAGLVERVQDERDRRRQVLELTEEAERVLRSVRSRRTAWLAKRLEHLSEDELAAVDHALDPLLALLERENG